MRIGKGDVRASKRNLLQAVLSHGDHINKRCLPAVLNCANLAANGPLSIRTEGQQGMTRHDTQGNKA
eukprot:1159677-Pelagomonas_calceolata.AAC.6